MTDPDEVVNYTGIIVECMHNKSHRSGEWYPILESFRFRLLTRYDKKKRTFDSLYRGWGVPTNLLQCSTIYFSWIQYYHKLVTWEGKVRRFLLVVVKSSPEPEEVNRFRFNVKEDKFKVCVVNL